MIEEQAYIVSLTHSHVLIEIQHQSSCGSCSAKASCGTSSLSQLFGNRPSRFSLEIDSIKTSKSLKVGHVIMIGLEDSAYLKASFMMYLLPLLSMLSFAILAEQFFNLAEAFVLLLAIFGLWSGFKFSQLMAHKTSESLSPQFIKIIKSDDIL